MRKSTLIFASLFVCASMAGCSPSYSQEEVDALKSSYESTISDLQSKVDEMQSEVDALQARITELESYIYTTIILLYYFFSNCKPKPCTS